MSFLSPLLLLLGAGAAIPLLLHLMRRRTGTRIEFPAARYLLRAEREHSRQVKLRNLLLLVLRVLAIIAIALAAAKPVSRLVPTAAAHAPAVVALVLDNSLSTLAIVGGRSVLDGLKDDAGRVLGRLSVSDRVWLLTADGAVQGGTPTSLRTALSRVRVLGAAGDPPAAVARAAALVSNAAALTAGDAVVGVLTDGQATTWNAPGTPVDVGATRVVVLAPAAAPPPNHAVLEADAQPVRWTPRGAVTGRIGGVADSATYRIDLGGRTLARGTVSAGAGAEPVVSVHAAPSERGWLPGSIELQPDELRADDIRHFAVWIGPPPAIDADSGVGPFVSGALSTLMSTGRAAAGGATRVAVVPADRVNTLPALIVAPSDPVRVGAANRALERAGVPWRFAPLRTGAPERITGLVLNDDTTRADADISVTRRYPLTAYGVAPRDTLVRAGGAPWIVAGPGYVLVALPLDPAATSFPIRASFVPWVDDVLTQQLGAGTGAILHTVPGATVDRPDGVEQLEGPDGVVRNLVGTSLTMPATPGVYFLRRGGVRAGAIVSDGEARESDLRRLPAAGLAGRLKSSVRRGARVYADPPAWVEALLSGNGTRSVLAPLLFVALLALAAESIVARRSSRPDDAGARSGAAGGSGRRAAHKAA